jgi:hypothetical protein
VPKHPLRGKRTGPAAEQLDRMQRRFAEPPCAAARASFVGSVHSEGKRAHQQINTDHEQGTHRSIPFSRPAIGSPPRIAPGPARTNCGHWEYRAGDEFRIRRAGESQHAPYYLPK